MTVKLVMLNGEPQVGKSTFSDNLRDMLTSHNSVTDPAAIRQYSLVDPFKATLTELFVWDNPNVVNIPDYATLKQVMIAGQTGRAWMIAFGNAARGLDQNILCRFLESQIKGAEDGEIIIVDNLGFKSELDYFRQRSTELQLITIYLGERATREYQTGEQFAGDNRFCLKEWCDYVDPTVESIAGGLLGLDLTPPEVQVEASAETPSVASISAEPQNPDNVSQDATISTETPLQTELPTSVAEIPPV